MRKIGEILLLSLAGAVLCAFSFWVYFVAQAAIEGNNAGEAAFYGILFGFGAFVVGGFIGALVAMLRANLLGGAALGLLGVAVFVILWTLGQGDAGSFAIALVRSAPFAIWFTVPGLFTGVVVAFLRIRRERKRVALTPGQPV